MLSQSVSQLVSRSS